MDDAHHVITGACASTSGSKDSVIFPDIMNQTLENCRQNNIEIDEVLADAGYSSAEALKYCKEKGINANYELYFCSSAAFVNAAHFQTSDNTNQSAKALFLTKNRIGMSV